MKGKKLEKETRLAKRWVFSKGKLRNTPYHFGHPGVEYHKGSGFYRDEQLYDLLAFYKGFVIRQYQRTKRK